LALLAVHPDHQRKGIGGKLLDMGLQMVDSSDPPLPTVLESSPEGFKLYNTRGFELSTAAAHVRGLDEPLPVMVRAAQDKR
jgi:predicted N-acetyltransferase YhbS